MPTTIYAVHTADAGTHLFRTRLAALGNADPVRDEVVAYRMPDYFAKALLTHSAHTHQGSRQFAEMVEAQGGEVL
jgi:hypothetical protein